MTKKWDVVYNNCGRTSPSEISLEALMDIFQHIFSGTLEELDKRILEEAREAFLEKGYAGMNVDAIASQIGIGKGTIYRHFVSKSFLFLAVVVYTYREMVSHFLVIDPVEDPHQALHQYITTLIDLNIRLGRFFVLLNPEEFGRECLMESGADARLQSMVANFKEEKTKFLQIFSSILSQLQEGGYVTRDIPSSELAHMILVLVNNYFRQVEASQGEEKKKYMMSFVYNALQYKSKEEL